MVPESVSMQQKRRAALTLHALDAGDRAWILERIPVPQRVELQSLLDELMTLGIPDDPDLLCGVLAARAPAECIGELPSESFDATAWADTLAHEPMGVVRGCLASLQRLERDDVLRRLPVHVQAEVSLPESGDAAPALRTAVARVIARRADSSEGT